MNVKIKLCDLLFFVLILFLNENPKALFPILRFLSVVEQRNAEEKNEVYFPQGLNDLMRAK